MVAAYCLALRRYGLELADEGVLLAHMDRVAHGQVPYRDFHVGYGPALYWLHAVLFGAWGPSIETVRVGLAVVHALRAVLLGLVAGAVGDRGWAAGAVLALVAFFLPVAPGLCATGNIPYPAWYADALGLVALVTIARRTAPVVLVGMLWGLVFAFKQNYGLLGLGAAAVTTVLGADPSADERRGIGVALAVALVAGAVLLLHELLDVMLATVFIVPLLPLAIAVARRGVGGATVRALVGLAIGFVAVAGAVVAVMMARAGAAVVWTDFLQIGTDTVRVYHLPHPTFGALTADVDGVGFARAARLVGDAAWFVVFPAVHLVATTLVATGRVRARLAIALVALAAIGYLQVYPRMDFWHLLPVAAVSLATLALVATAGGPVVGRTVLAILLVTALVRLVPTVPVLAAIAGGASGPPRVPRLDVRWDLLHEEALVRLPDVVEALHGRRRVAGFPALGVVNFALGTPSPWRHDYFFPGRPTPSEERELVAATLRDPPDAVVVLEEASPLRAAFAAHPAIVDMLARAFVEERRIGPYRILVPGPGR